RLALAGTPVDVRLQTNYPWNGEVRLDVTPTRPVEGTFALRLPAWCQRPTLRLNGKAFEPQRDRGRAVITRRWEAGDSIELQLPMPPRLVRSHPKVAANAGCAAIARGPFVYCLESLDHDVALERMYLSDSPKLQAVHRDDLFPDREMQGIEAITTQARVRHPAPDDVPLYGDAAEYAAHQTTPLLAIPFYLHSNREPSDRLVWTPLSAERAALPAIPTLAGRAQFTASHCWTSDTIDALNDELLPTASDDGNIPRFTWWDHRGTAEWIHCDLDEATKISEVQVYWWDERRVGAHCRTPQHWRVSTLGEDGWQPIANQTRGGVAIDCFNSVVFPKQRLKTIRIDVQLQPGWSGGILELQLKP
ncbi:MAG: glycoside hydrolase family 127 protein, partial [Planctomycetales bacterium]|nr:glycoside hydrolase family 127 protein [Planctomycetales bacterium]